MRAKSYCAGRFSARGGEGAAIIRALKLIVQIPCLDEEQELPRVLEELPREVEGFDAVEWLVIDDGSTDRTLEVAHDVADLSNRTLEHRRHGE